MTNVNAPYGFRAITPNARIQSYTILSTYGTTINAGDPVVLSGTGLGMLAEVNIASTLNPVVGVFAGVSYTDSNGQPQLSKSWPASTVATNIVCQVYDDPATEFAIQSNGTFAITDYGNKAAFASGTGTQGISGYVLDTSSTGTGTDLQIRSGFDQAPNNAVGLYTQLIVAFRLHLYNTFTAV